MLIMKELTDLSILAGAAIVAGAMNSVAGGGTFITFPVLIMLGVPPIVANATNNVAAWAGTLGTLRGYREEIAGLWRPLLPSWLLGIAGGMIGAVLLLATPEAVFTKIIPWLLLIATALFASSGPLRKLSGDACHPGLIAPALYPLVLLVAIYGGYFGAGIGMMNLALLALSGVTNVHRANGMKSLLGFGITGVACLPFAFAGKINWPLACIQAAAMALGAYVGARGARRLPPSLVRSGIVMLGLAMSVYFFRK